MQEFLDIARMGMLHVAIDPVLQKQQEVKQLSKRVRENLSDGTTREHNSQLPHNDSGWWDDLSYDEQLAYLKAHRNSKFKITKHHLSEDPIEMSGKNESLSNSNMLHKNHKLAIQKNIETTQFKKNEDGKTFAELPVGNATVQLDVDDWKKAIKQKLKLERDPISKRMVLKGEKYESRVTEDGIDENEKYRVLAGSLFGEGLKNWRMEYKDGNPYNLQRSNIVAKTFEAGIEDQIKQFGAKDIEFRRHQFDQDGLTIEAPGFVPKIEIDGVQLPLNDGFPDVKSAMLAQDLATIENNQHSGKGTNIAMLNTTKHPEIKDSEISADDRKFISDLVKFGTPERAEKALLELETAEHDARDLGEDEILTMASRAENQKSPAWQRIRDIIDPKLPDGISKSDVEDAGISTRDLLELDKNDAGEIFNSIRESMPKDIPTIQMNKMIDSVPDKDEPVAEPKERRPSEPMDRYTARVAQGLYKADLDRKKWSMPERYDWFRKNKEIFENYSNYMNFMNNMKLMGDKMFREDKGGIRGSARKAIHIPILLYPANMDPQDTEKHKYIFKKHKFHDMGSIDGSHHLWQLPGIYGRPTIDHHKGGYSPGTGRAFGPQAGFDVVDEKDNFREKKHYDMLRKLGYPQMMDRIWDEYNDRKRSGAGTLETAPPREASMLDLVKIAMSRVSKHSSLLLKEFMNHIGK